MHLSRKIVICLGKKKVKFSRYRPGVAHRVGRGIALLFHDRGTRRGWVVSSTPRSHFIPRKDSVPILQEARWAPGPFWTGAENLVPTGNRSRTVQPVVSRYTDWATRPTIYLGIYPLPSFIETCLVIFEVKPAKRRYPWKRTYINKEVQCSKTRRGRSKINMAI